MNDKIHNNDSVLSTQVTFKSFPGRGCLPWKAASSGTVCIRGQHSTRSIITAPGPKVIARILGLSCHLLIITSVTASLLTSYSCVTCHACVT